MNLSITAEKAANDAQPIHIAFGPPLCARMAPVVHPAYILLYMSCLALIFSITHSEPAKRAPMAPKPLAYDLYKWENDLFC
jgi:hypothetical protein